eukprot:CAMPEP_0185267812 /NCGR_PEP_ID=MMETSP1359-20130426/35345_1 /TAXON_ID=552665 /ORGANISM="Bigelowiella longifila, Strain CCMP242" /LENGTH=151 /DNA_ID=CAMNT_0027858313 /DNA_START=197 /DNA_END=652 /DNA_ORIENTATION=+
MATTYQLPLSSSPQPEQQRTKEEKQDNKADNIADCDIEDDSTMIQRSRRRSSIFANRLRFRAPQLQRRLGSKKKAHYIPLAARGREKSYGEKLKGLKGKRLKRQQEQAQMSSKFRDFNQKRVLDRISTPFVAPKQMFVPVEPKELESSVIS